MPTEQEYWEALQAKICSRCLDGDGKGECLISREYFCAMKTHLPLIVDAINSVYSQSMEPYEEQLRKTVCANCVHQSMAGECALRDDVECALDRYFPLIVQVIEETQLRDRFGKTARRS